MLTLTHRPKMKDVKGLAEKHDLFVTLLNLKEHPGNIGQYVPPDKWLWYPFSQWQLNEDAKVVAGVRAVAEEIARALTEGKRVLIHCAAGIDRTGIVALSAMMLTGMTWGDALAKLSELRPMAHEKMLAKHLPKVRKILGR